MIDKKLLSQMIDHICRSTKIDLNDNLYTLVKVGEKIKKLNLDADYTVLNEFIDFIDSNKNHYDLKFVSKGWDRFITIYDLYEREINKEREAEAQSQSQLLERKFYDIKTQLKQEHSKGLYPTLEQLRANGTTYFSSFELGQLNAIGEPNYLISLSDSHKLQEKLDKGFVKLIYKTKVIENKQQVKLPVKRF